MDSEPIADEPPQINTFWPYSLVGNGEAEMVGQCRFKIDLLNNAPGGV
jgi:hypothetical protein